MSRKTNITEATRKINTGFVEFLQDISQRFEAYARQFAEDTKSEDEEEQHVEEISSDEEQEAQEESSFVTPQKRLQLATRRIVPSHDNSSEETEDSEEISQDDESEITETPKKHQLATGRTTSDSDEEQNSQNENVSTEEPIKKKRNIARRFVEGEAEECSSEEEPTPKKKRLPTRRQLFPEESIEKSVCQKCEKSEGELMIGQCGHYFHYKCVHPMNGILWANCYICKERVTPLIQLKNK